MAHVFISYVRENNSKIDKLREQLESHGIKVWLDRNEIMPGCRWEDAIREAIEKGEFFIACFSREYSNKHATYMNEELTLAIERLRRHSRNRLWFIPVLFSGEVPNWPIGAGQTLRSLQWVRLDADWEAGIQQILSVIKPARVRELIQALKHPFARVRIDAAHQLGSIDGPVQEIVPALIEALDDENVTVCANAAAALGQIGEPAKDAALDLARKIHKDHYGSLTAIRALQEIGEPAILVLLDALGTQDAEVREYAASALGEIGHPMAVPALVEAFEDEIPRVRWSVVHALGQIGPSAKATLPALMHALNDESYSIRGIAANAIGQIGSAAKAAVPALIEALKDESSDVCSSAAWALGYIGPAAKAAVPVLIEVLDANHEGFPGPGAARALGKIGLEAKAAVPALIEALKDEESNSVLRSAVVEALGNIGPEAKAAVPALIEALRFEKDTAYGAHYLVRRSAANALGNIGSAARAAIPALIEALKDENKEFREAVQRALMRIEGG